MLAKVNRVRRGTDYKSVVRQGTRLRAPHTVTYMKMRPDEHSVRFGFIVGKPVGGATRRNLVRRRMKAVCFDLLPMVSPGTDIVIRALPGSADISWDTLQKEIIRAVSKVGKR